MGKKPIIEHNIDRLIRFGIEEVFISVNYLKHIITDYFQDGTEKGIKIQYLVEYRP